MQTLNLIMYLAMVAILVTNAIFAGIVRLNSHSDIWYFLEEYDKKNATYWRYWFPASTMIYSTLLVLIGIQFSEWALCGLSLYYVAFAPHFETKGAPKVAHVFGALIAILGSQVMLWVLGYGNLSICAFILSVISYLTLKDKAKITYWVENWAMLYIIILYYLLLF